jgi:hypothetical protein
LAPAANPKSSVGSGRGAELGESFAGGFTAEAASVSLRGSPLVFMTNGP